MKKITALLMALTLALSLLVGCGSGNRAGGGEAAADAAVSSVESLDTKGNADAASEDGSAETEEKSMTSDAVYSGTCGYDAVWTLTGDGVLTISGTGKTVDCFTHNSWNTAPWDRPEEDDGEFPMLKRVIIEEGITELGKGSFYGCGMEEIVLPESMKVIGEEAIDCSYSLEKINLPSGLERVGRWNFSTGCEKVENLEQWLALVETEEDADAVSSRPVYEKKQPADRTLSNGLMVKGSMVTDYEGTAQEVTIPDEITEIGSYAFLDDRITDLYIPETVTDIGAYAIGFRRAEVSDFAVAPQADVTIHGAVGSAADLYAQEYDIHFEAE